MKEKEGRGDMTREEMTQWRRGKRRGNDKGKDEGEMTRRTRTREKQGW